MKSTVGGAAGGTTAHMLLNLKGTEVSSQLPDALFLMAGMRGSKVKHITRYAHQSSCSFFGILERVILKLRKKKKKTTSILYFSSYLDLLFDRYNFTRTFT